MAALLYRGQQAAFEIASDDIMIKDGQVRVVLFDYLIGAVLYSVAAVSQVNANPLDSVAACAKDTVNGMRAGCLATIELCLVPKSEGTYLLRRDGLFVSRFRLETIQVTTGRTEDSQVGLIGYSAAFTLDSPNLADADVLVETFIILLTVNWDARRIVRQTARPGIRLFEGNSLHAEAASSWVMDPGEYSVFVFMFGQEFASSPMQFMAICFKQVSMPAQ